MSKGKVLKMYNDKLYIPEHENENKIFYFVREPGFRKYDHDKSEGDSNVMHDYVDYLTFMEGTAEVITLESFCFEGVLILDGSFTIPVSYNDVMKIKIGDNKIRTFKGFH